MSSSASTARTPFAGHALLVSNEWPDGGQVTRALQQFAFTVDICQSLESAARLVSIRKFQAIIVDEGANEQMSILLDIIRSSPSNRAAVTFAIVGADKRSGSKICPNFLLHRPLTDALLASTLKAAMGSIIRDYRRYFRCPLKVPATIQTGGGPSIVCELMNISEGGVALSNCAPLQLGVSVTVRFELPDTVGEFQVDADVCWSDNRSRAGLHFSVVSPEQKTRLQNWLSDRIEEGFPDPIVQLFRNQP